MKKTLEIFMIALMAFMLLFVVTQPTTVLAEDVTSLTDQIKPEQNGGENTNGLTTTAKKITNLIWVLSVVIAVIVLMVIGVKYIVGGVQEKAKYKESLIPVVVGIVVIVSATTIVNFLFNF